MDLGCSTGIPQDTSHPAWPQHSLATFPLLPAPPWPRNTGWRKQERLRGDSQDPGLSGITGGCFHFEIVEINSLFWGKTLPCCLLLLPAL